MWCLRGPLAPQALGLLVFISCSHMTYAFPLDGVKGQSVQEVPYSSSNSGSRGVTSAPFNNDPGATGGAAGVGGNQGLGVYGRPLDSVINSTTGNTSEAPASPELTSASPTLQENATLYNDSALYAVSEVPPLAAGGSYGNSGLASAAPPMAETTPSPLDTSVNGGYPDASDAGADTKVPSDEAANKGSDDNDEEDVIVVVVSNDYGDGNNDGNDVNGSDGDHDDDSGTFKKGPGGSSGVKGHQSAQ
ncbi:uncharacterized protein LOC144752963 [Lissotriton helveticus]